MVMYTYILSIHKIETNLDYIVLVIFKNKNKNKTQTKFLRQA